MYKTIPQMLQQIRSEYGKTEVQLWKDNKGQYHPTTYEEFYDEVTAFAAGLKGIGIKRGDHIGLISDNRREWLISDLAILSLGAADVPRGRDAMPYELEYILGFSGCRHCLVENEDQLKKVQALKSSLPDLKYLIVMDPNYTPQQNQQESSEKDKKNSTKTNNTEKAEKADQSADCTIMTFQELLETGKKAHANTLRAVENDIEKGTEDEIATIIFTSGTTGEPKGVMLTHMNFLHQVNTIDQVVDVRPGDRWLSVLPVWHSFERILQYIIIGKASTIAYSKPIGKIMLQDFVKVNPAWMGSVPRIWESVKAGVYRNVKGKSSISQGLFHFFVWVGSRHANLKHMLKNEMPQFHRRIYLFDFIIAILPYLILSPLKALGDHLVFGTIKKKFGTKFKAGVSGGGSLSESVDNFFQAIGLTLLDGYGLTETAPVIGIRFMNRQVPSTVSPYPGTEIKIIDENGKPVKPGVKGQILARGPQVMKGYYKRDDLTKKIITSDGWLKTGDLGMWTHKGEYSIRGRVKDTIVLSGGENIEPVPIEMKLRESEYIEQAVVLGQDKKYLAALIVPDSKQLELYVKNNGIPYMSRHDLLDITEVTELINYEVNELVSSKNGFKSFEHIYRFKLLPWSFEIGKELSAKQEIKRHKIQELYKKEIEQLFS